MIRHYVTHVLDYMGLLCMKVRLHCAIFCYLMATWFADDDLDDFLDKLTDIGGDAF